MFLPSGVNPIEFYQATKQKGIRITSRYTGVKLNIGRYKQISWLVTHQFNNKVEYLGTFPFTTEGEEEARNVYIRRLERLGLPVREKKKYKLKPLIKPNGKD